MVWACPLVTLCGVRTSSPCQELKGGPGEEGRGRAPAHASASCIQGRAGLPWRAGREDPPCNQEASNRRVTQ